MKPTKVGQRLYLGKDDLKGEKGKLHVNGLLLLATTDNGLLTTEKWNLSSQLRI
jgi:hypothetical protein